MNQATATAIIILIFSSISGLTLAQFVWRQRLVWSGWFALACIAIAIWSAFYALELAAPTLADKIFWGQFQYLGIATVPVAWFLFAQSFAGNRQWLQPLRVILLCVIPLAAVLLAFTNSSHHLFWETIHLNTDGPFSVYDATYGPGWYLFSIFAYAALLIGTAVLFLSLHNFANTYRWQLVILAVALILPWLANILYVTRLSPIPQLDLAPLGFTISAFLLTVGILRFRLFSIAPVARSAVVDNMSIAMLVLDNRNRVLDVNPAARRLFKLGQTAVEGQPARSVLGRWAEYATIYADVDETKEEIGIQAQEGRRTFNLQISPILDRRQKKAGRLVLLQDITTLKQAEEAVARATAKTELLAKVGHELRTPLNGIIGLAEMIEFGVYGEVHPAQKEALQKIIDRTQHMNRLVNDILMQIRLEQDQFSLQLDTINVIDMVDACTETVEAAVSAKNLTFTSEIDPDVPTQITTDPIRLHQIMVNLVDNAIKFTNEGSIHLRVFCLDADHWGFSVADTGIGIPPHMHEEIFEPFRQIDYKITRQTQGAGLGLSIARQFVNLMNGTIEVQSETGKGSTFTVTLPFITETAQARNA